jgi:hypothetical protein
MLCFSEASRTDAESTAKDLYRDCSAEASWIRKGYCLGYLDAMFAAMDGLCVPGGSIQTGALQKTFQGWAERNRDALGKPEAAAVALAFTQAFGCKSNPALAQAVQPSASDEPADRLEATQAASVDGSSTARLEAPQPAHEVRRYKRRLRRPRGSPSHSTADELNYEERNRLAASGNQATTAAPSSASPASMPQGAHPVPH